MTMLGHRIVRLVTGETLIARVALVGKTFILTDPMSLVVTPSNRSKNKAEAQSYDVFMTRWMDFTDQRSFAVSPSSMITMARADESTIADYEMSMKQEDERFAEKEFEELFEGIGEDGVDLDQPKGDETDGTIPPESIPFDPFPPDSDDSFDGSDGDSHEGPTEDGPSH